MKASANNLLHPFLQPDVVGTDTGQALHTMKCHKGPFPLLQIQGFLFQLCVIIWINCTLLFSLPSPRSSSHSSSSCHPKSAINPSPTSCCCLCLRRWYPGANHRMFYCINAAWLCQHLTLNKETAHTRVPWPWAAVSRQVNEVQHMNRPGMRTLGAALPGPFTPLSGMSTLGSLDIPLSCVKNRSAQGNHPTFPLETSCKTAAGLCWWHNEMWCHILWWPLIRHLSFHFW